MFQAFCSISGVAYYNMMNSSPEHVFHRPGKELYQLIKDNLTGGFTSGNTRYFKKGESRLRDEDGKKYLT